MARIQTGSIITDISGSIGGTTFQRGTHGLIAKNKSHPPNFNSSAQNYCRNLMAQLQTYWQALSVAQRSAWQNWAKYQNLKSGKFTSIDFYGQEAFIQINFYGIQNGLSLITDPVFTAFSLAPQTFHFYQIDGQILVTITTTDAHTAFQPVLQISSPQLPSRNAPSGQWKNCVATWATDSNWNLTPDYVACFGKVPQSSNIVFALTGAIQISNRTLSAFTRQRYTVT